MRGPDSTERGSTGRPLRRTCSASSGGHRRPRSWATATDCASSRHGAIRRATVGPARRRRDWLCRERSLAHRPAHTVSRDERTLRVGRDRVNFGEDRARRGDSHRYIDCLRLRHCSYPFGWLVTSRRRDRNLNRHGADCQSRQIATSTGWHVPLWNVRKLRSVTARPLESCQYTTRPRWDCPDSALPVQRYALASVNGANVIDCPGSRYATVVGASVASDRDTARPRAEPSAVNAPSASHARIRKQTARVRAAVFSTGHRSNLTLCAPQSRSRRNRR